MVKSRSSDVRVLFRLIVILLAVGVLLISVTFALLQSQAVVMRGNTIQTASPSIKISEDGVNYQDEIAGFSVDSLVPGGPAKPQNGISVYLKNTGSAAVEPRISLSDQLSTTPTDLDLSKVHIIITPTTGGEGELNITLADIATAAPNGGLVLSNYKRLAINGQVNLTIRISLDKDIVNGPTAQINNFDIKFTGVAVG